MGKILCLNSGGFDSTVMMHMVADTNPDSEFISLFFDYGQPNMEQERKWARYNASKLGFSHNEIKLPEFGWTSGSFYDQEKHHKIPDESQYLEYRNLVMFSYALSFATSVGAGEVYAAILKSHGYSDTSSEFLFYVSDLFEYAGVKFRTPFSVSEKEELVPLANKYCVEVGKYFSCNYPLSDGKPCGECGDCKAMVGIEKHMSDSMPVRAYYKYGTRSAEFKKSFTEFPITELRMLINNDCQLKCSHCFYGFDEMKKEKLTNEQLIWRGMIPSILWLGVRNIHFSGKEPLMDDSIFEYVEILQKYNVGLDTPVTWDVVSNGVNVAKYAGRLKEHGVSRVCLSADTGFRRSSNFLPQDAVLALMEHNIPMHVFVDVSPDSVSETAEVIRYIHDMYAVNDFYVRTVRRVGKASKLDIIPFDKLNAMFEAFFKLCSSDSSLSIELGVGPDYVGNTVGSLADNIHETLAMGTSRVLANLSVDADHYCGRFESQITLTPDGYVLGCGVDVCEPNYDRIAAGNIMDASIVDIVKAGKEQSLKLIRAPGVRFHCIHEHNFAMDHLCK